MRFKDPAIQFFYKHAGYSYDPKTESKIQGRIRCAKALAQAERTAKQLNWEYLWDSDWDIGSHVKFYGSESYSEEPSTCEWCQLRDENDTVLESLGCIDDADNNYRRVVQAELALEAITHRNIKLDREANASGDVPDVIPV